MRAKPHADDRNSLRLSIDNDMVEKKSRLVHVALLNLNLRFLENWRSAQIGSGRAALDYKSLMILMATIVISAERVVRTELDPDLQTLAQQLPASKVTKVNLSSIAARDCAQSRDGPAQS